MIRRFAVTVCALALVASIASAAFAAKGGNKDPVPSALTLNQNPHLGEWVNFATTYPNSVKNPRIAVNCYQPDLSGTLVWGQVGLVTDSFKLGGDSSAWLTNGGDAMCEADLYNLTWNGNNPQQVDVLVSIFFTAFGA